MTKKFTVCTQYLPENIIFSFFNNQYDIITKGKARLKNTTE
jgi:hypothetical protein